MMSDFYGFLFSFIIPEEKNRGKYERKKNSQTLNISTVNVNKHGTQLFQCIHSISK